MPDSAFVIFVLLVVATAASGAVFKPGAWYERLDKPGWTPPDWAFPVVWTILYAMIAYAGWLVWREAGLGLVVVVWLAQLVFNAMWSWLFFGRKRMDLAFADVVALWLSVAAFIVLAWPVSALAGLLFVPYLVWVTIAAALNYRVWSLNPQTS